MGPAVPASRVGWGVASSIMPRARLCARPGCGEPAAATLAFQYATKTAWLDDLAESEPCAIDLCRRHADRLTPPIGWQGHDRRAGSQPAPAPAQVAS